jgi:hypothetical protein
MTTEYMTETEAIGMVLAVADINDETKGPLKDKEGFVARLKQWLQLEGRTELIDGEAGVRAYLQPKRAHTYDLPSLVTHDSKAGEYLAEAARAGFLKVDHSALETFIKNTGGSAWAAALMRYHDEAGSNEALYVERK